LKKIGFTLLELVIVIIIIGILATLGITQYGVMKEKILAKEAITNLKLIAAAQKTYRLEKNSYYPSTGSQSNITAINSNLSLQLNEDNWVYNITGGANFTAYANRKSGAYSSCRYAINQSLDEPYVSSGTCP